MTLKRKRSWNSPTATPFSQFSSPSNSQSAAGPSSDRSTSPSSSYQCQTRSFSSIDSHDSHLSSRTFKRHRDSRPCEAKIHSHTMQKLFAGARQLRHPPPLNDHPGMPSNQACTPMHMQGEPEVYPANSLTNLHAFWNLPNSPESQQYPIRPISRLCVDSTSQRCEHCDDFFEDDPSVGTLGSMDCTDTFESSWACNACGRAVCGKCATYRGLHDRLCLECVLR